MKGRVILLNLDPTLAALMVDGRLQDLMVDTPTATSPEVGQIYRATVDRVAGHGAFLRLGPDHMGFLKETKGIAAGRTCTVQVIADTEPGKAVPVTTKLLFKGRFLILTPGAPGLNVSRQIRKEEVREDLTERVGACLSDRGIDRSTGLIVRSAAATATDHELAADLDRLLCEAEATRADDPTSGHPVGGQRTTLTRALDEWADPAPDDVIVNAAALTAGAPNNPLPLVGAGRLEAMARVEPDALDHLGVWDEIEHLKSPRADLPSGGWMAIEATRALIAVDVNTGDQFSGGAAMTANIEAARELPRQLRLRGLGGQITIDFAPVKKMHRKKIEETLKTAFRRDPIATTQAGWTPLGNFELQRKRERRPLADLT